MDPTPGREPPYTLIRDLPETERPRERLRDHGAPALNNGELLAILLRVGSAKESALSLATRLLARFGGLDGLYRASFTELCAVSGLGPAKVAQIKAALELGVRITAVGEEKPIMRTPEDLATMMLAEMSLLDQEEVRVVLLDTRNHITATTTVYRGSVHTAHIRVAELLAEPVRAKAPCIVLVHNHPSGDPTPSAADVQMTRELNGAAKLMGIGLLDHLVMAGGRYVSMQAMRLGFTPNAPADGAA